MIVRTDPAGIGEVPNRTRRWGARFLRDSDVRDYPETHELTREEWARMHSDYGLTIKGLPA